MAGSRHLVHRDRESARRFQETIVPNMLGPWILELIGPFDLRPGDHVLDLACGTGAVAREVAGKVLPGGAVIGVDVNLAMLEVAREAEPASGERIRWVAGDAVAVPISDDSVDAVVCQQGLQFFQDRERAAREMKRVLRPGGRMAAAVWSRIERNPYCLSMARSLAVRVGEEVGDQFRLSFSLGDLRELRRLFEEAGFEAVETRTVTKELALPPLPEFIPGQLGSSSVAPMIESAGAEARAGIVADVMRDLGGSRKGGTPAFTFEVNFAAARRRDHGRVRGEHGPESNEPASRKQE